MTATMTYQAQNPHMFQQQQYLNHGPRSVSQPGQVMGPPSHTQTPEQLRMQQQAQHADKLRQYHQQQQRIQQNGMMLQPNHQMMMDQLPPQRPGVQRTPSNSQFVNGIPQEAQQRHLINQQQHAMSSSPFPVGPSNPEIAALHERRMQNDRAYMEQQRIMALQQQAQMQGQVSGPPPQQMQHHHQNGLPIFPAVNGNHMQQRAQPVYSRPPSQASQYPANNPPQLTVHQQQAFHAARERQQQQNGPRSGISQQPSSPSAIASTSYTIPTTPASTLPARSSSLIQSKPPQPMQVFSANGIATMRLLQYTQALARATEEGMEGVKKFCSDFYTDKASIKMIVTSETTGEVRSHEIPISVFPRLMAISYKAGARSFGLIFESPQETQSVFPTPDGKLTPTGHFQVDCPAITHTTSYANGTLCISVGSARYHLRRFALPPSANSPARMIANGKAPVILKIEYAEMRLVSHQHLVIRPTKSLSQAQTPMASDSAPKKKDGSEWDEDAMLDLDPFMMDSPAPPKRPEKIDEAGGYQFPELMVNEFGVAPTTMDFMQVSEMIHNIGDLIYTTTTESIGPQEALSRYASLNVPSSTPIDSQPSTSFTVPTATPRSIGQQQLGIRIPDAPFDPGPSSAPIISASHLGPTPPVLPLQQTHPSSAPTSPAGNKRKMDGLDTAEDDDIVIGEGPRVVKRARGVTMRG